MILSDIKDPYDLLLATFLVVAAHGVPDNERAVSCEKGYPYAVMCYRRKKICAFPVTSKLVHEDREEFDRCWAAACAAFKTAHREDQLKFLQQTLSLAEIDDIEAKLVANGWAKRQ